LKKRLNLGLEVVRSELKNGRGRTVESVRKNEIVEKEDSYSNE